MAIGDITTTGDKGARRVELLASVTAANGAPSGGSAGLPLSTLRGLRSALPATGMRVGVASTAGSGTMTVTVRLWAYMGAAWVVWQNFAASTAAPQTAVAIVETGTDSIAYSEDVGDIRACDRLYLEVTAIAGTSTAVTGYVYLPAEA